jgi:hypothetical protein
MVLGKEAERLDMSFHLVVTHPHPSMGAAQG